jgi:hypothetical protein
MWTWWYSTSTFEHSEQASHISEGVAEIRINITLQGINLATQHTWATKATRVTTFRDDYQRVEPGPPYPSVVFNAKTSTGSPWVVRTLFQCHPWSTVGCRPTQQPSTLLTLRNLINPVCASTQPNTYCNMVQPTQSLIDSGSGYHIKSSEYEDRALSTFPSGILHFSLLVLPDLT